jgi:hypothetical protein
LGRVAGRTDSKASTHVDKPTHLPITAGLVLDDGT